MKLFLGISFILFVVFKLHSQSIVSKYLVKDKAVVIRFVSQNNTLWEECKTKGFKIERTEVASISDTNTIDKLVFTQITPVPLKPLDKLSKDWESIISTTDYGAFIYKGLYGTPVAKDEKSKQSLQVIWGMLMKQADLNVESAKLLGLYFKDTEINSGKMYLYRISVVEKVGPPKYKATFFVDSKIESYLPPISLKLAGIKQKQISLSFEAKKNEAYYSGFILERSLDSVNGFEPVTKKPLIYIVGEHEKNKVNITHQDTLPDTKQFYFYRLKGITYFGVTGPYSDVIKVKGKAAIGSYPFIDSVKLVNKETQLKINFHFLKEANLSIIKGLIITRSDKSGKASAVISQKLLPPLTTYFIDENPLATNYYKVLALTFDGDTVSSFEGFGMLPDRTPPEVPSEIKGFIDSIGLVHLNWKANLDKDLQGYRIFRKNDLTEELAERTRRIVTTNTYVDTVDLKTLTKFIYYSLTSVDKVFNNSKYSSVIKLKRPDIIAPVAPVFIQTSHNNKNVELKWYRSTSDDIEKYELYRINFKTKIPEKLKEWGVADTTAFYNDSLAEVGETYQYKLVVYDDSKNKSESISPFVIYETGLRKPITDFNYIIDLEKRNIHLNWSYSQQNIYNFIIYKAKQGEPFRIYKTVKPAQLSLIDTNVFPGTVYLYQIKATYVSGVESKLSKEIKVIF